MSEPLHTKYRPSKFEDVIGQDAAVKALRGIIKRKSSRAFLLTGPTGTGKTTLARIAAIALGAGNDTIIEIDAATHTGVDNVRQIQDVLRYKPFGDVEVRAIIVDEAHGLSKQSWDALLKSIEEPPAHIVWFFCTTNPIKVPATIKSRCTAVTLKPVPLDALNDLLDDVCDAEQIDLPDDVLDTIAEMAGGSPRQMLVNLNLCRDVTNRKVAAELLKGAVEGDAIRELCQFLSKGGSWMKCAAILKKLDGENPEGVRIAVVNYFAAVVRGAKSDRQALAALSIIQEFATPYNQAENMAPLYLSIGHALAQGRE